MAKGAFSKFIVTLVVIMNISFTFAVLYVYLRVGSEPTVLIGAWFGFTTGELWMLSSISKTKLRKRRVVSPNESENQLGSETLK